MPRRPGRSPPRHPAPTPGQAGRRTVAPAGSSSRLRSWSSRLSSWFSMPAIEGLAAALARRSLGKAPSNSGKARSAPGLAARLRLYSPAMARRIAIVEDEPAIRANYAEALRKHGYEVAAYRRARRSARGDAHAGCPISRSSTSASATTSTAASSCAASCARCRRRCRSSSSPRATAISTSSSGLRLGADDYLTKDVSLPHLLARIAALFRRIDAAARSRRRRRTCSSAARSTLDPKRLTRHWNGSAVDLTLTEFWMVHALARFPGHVKNRDQLMRDAQHRRRRRHDHLAHQAHPQQNSSRPIRRSMRSTPSTAWAIGGRLTEAAALQPARQARAGALVLLALPWAGVLYVNEVERFLLEGQEQTLLAIGTRGGDRAARAAAAPRQRVRRATTRSTPSCSGCSAPLRASGWSIAATR